MKKHIHLKTLLLSALLVSFASCKDKKIDTDPQKPVVEHYGTTHGRTIIMYMVAENSLSGYHTQDINEILKSKIYIGPKDRVVVYLDDTDLPCIYAINYATEGESIGQLKPVKSYDKDVNSCNPQVLTDFIKYATSNYPAPSYALVLWSHASGWVPASRQYVQKRSFGIDNGKNTTRDNGIGMEILQLDSALTAADTHFDFILSDACFMQNIEVAYQLREHTETYIGSAAEIPAPGAPYDVLMPYIFADSLDARGLARQIVQKYVDTYRRDNQYGALLTAIDCDRLAGFAQFMASLMPVYRDRLITMDYDGVLDYFKYGVWSSSAIPYSDFYDIRGIMRRALMAEAGDVYDEWEREFKKIIVESQCTDWWYSTFNKRNNTCDLAQYSGISMHVPLAKYKQKNEPFVLTFPEYEWAKTVWTIQEHD